MKNFFLIPFFLISAILVAQTTERREIQGELIVPEGYIPEGIHIYNKTSGYGTASDAEGLFVLPVAIGDTLQFSAVQFQALELVITSGAIDSGYLKVEITEGLNELPEIFIRSHDLTGNVREDLNRIKIEKIPPMPPMQGLDKIIVEKSSPGNATMNEIGGGANHLALLVKGFRLLFPKRRKKEVPITDLTAYEQGVLEKELRLKFDDQFFLENFGIPVEEISSFIGFVASRGLKRSLLLKDREIELIQALMEQSEVYRSGT